jgi:hypothetical protein
MAMRGAVRLGAISACSLLALALTSCVGGLTVTVNSVTGALEPYNPATASSGVPAEQVDFTVSDYTSGSSPIVCLIDVYQNGAMVGTTLATFGSGARTSTSGGVQESDAVDISSPSPFDGTPSDATVGCVTKG